MRPYYNWDPIKSSRQTMRLQKKAEPIGSDINRYFLFPHENRGLSNIYIRVRLYRFAYPLLKLHYTEVP